MEHWKLTQWCTYAVSKIKYAPDRRAVYDELRQHLDDRCDDLLAQGMSKDEAADKAVEVMGDPRELAPLLAAVHPPFWGYACSITKWLMRIVAVVMIISLLVTGYRILNVRTTGSKLYNVYIEQSNSNITRILYAKPNCSDSSDGYTFTVTRVAIQQDIHNNLNGTQTFIYDLYIEVEVTKPHIWAADCFGTNAFWAMDDLGNQYAGWYNDDSIKSMTCTTYTENHFVQYYNYNVTYVDFNPAEELSWFELRYDRAGRDVILHIEL